MTKIQELYQVTFRKYTALVLSRQHVSPPVFAIVVCSKDSSIVSVLIVSCIFSPPVDPNCMLDQTGECVQTVNRTGEIRSEQASLGPDSSVRPEQSRSERMAAPQKGDLSASERKILQIIAAGELKDYIISYIHSAPHIIIVLYCKNFMTNMMHTFYSINSTMGM